MERRLKGLVGLIVCLIFIVSLSNCAGLKEKIKAPPEPRLKILKVEKLFYTTWVCGWYNDELSKVIESEDPFATRGIILEISSQVAGNVRVFAHDFIVRYFDTQGEEWRAKVRGIMPCQPASSNNFFNISEEPCLEISGRGNACFRLLAFIPFVEEMELCRIDGSVYKVELGPERAFSVTIATDVLLDSLEGDKKDRLMEIKTKLEEAGYYVYLDQGRLPEFVREIWFFYNETNEIMESEAEKVYSYLLTLGYSVKIRDLEKINSLSDMTIFLPGEEI